MMNIAIIGAGMSGLSTALFLNHEGFRATVYEKEAALTEAGAGIQIPPNASRHFARIGLLDKLKERAFKPTAIEIRRYANSQLLQKLPGNPIVEKLVGYPYLLIHRAHYQQLLYDACTQAGVEVIFGAHIKAVNADEPAITFENDEKLRFDLIVGADGTHSFIRKCISETEPIAPVITSHRAYRALVSSETMHTIPQGRALMASGVVTIWIGPRTHIVGYPISGSFYNLVMIHPGPVGEVESYVQQGSIEEMHTTYSEYDESVKSILSLAPHVRAWKILEMPDLPSWSSLSGKVVLVGDAAHAMLPYAAQGAAQGIEDAIVLATVLKLMSPLSELKHAMQVFESLRKPRVSRVVAAGRTGQIIRELPDGPQQEERDRKWREAAEAQKIEAARMLNNKSVADVDPGSSGGRLKEAEFTKWIWDTDVQAEAEAFITKSNSDIV